MLDPLLSAPSPNNRCGNSATGPDPLLEWMTPGEYFQYEMAAMVERRMRRAALEADAKGVGLRAAESERLRVQVLREAERSAQMGASGCEQLARLAARVSLRVMISRSSIGMGRELYGFHRDDGTLVATHEGFAAPHRWLRSAIESARIDMACPAPESKQITPRL